MRDRQDSGCHEPGQAHDGAYGQHHSHHQQVQMVPTAFLYRRSPKIRKASGLIWIWLKKCCLTSSLCSLRLTITAVICWSMKMRIVQRRAGIDATKAVHHGFRPIGLMNQPRSSLVGWRGNYQKYNAIMQLIILNGFISWSASYTVPLYLEFAWHIQLLGGYSNGKVNQDHKNNGKKHCKITDHRPHLSRRDNKATRLMIINTMQ